MSTHATVRRPREWWADHREIAALIRYLKAEGTLDESETAYLVEKPWKWDHEYQQMVRDEDLDEVTP